MFLSEQSSYLNVSNHPQVRVPTTRTLISWTFSQRRMKSNCYLWLMLFILGSQTVVCTSDKMIIGMNTHKGEQLPQGRVVTSSEEAASHGLRALYLYESGMVLISIKDKLAYSIWPDGHKRDNGAVAWHHSGSLSAGRINGMFESENDVNTVRTTSAPKHDGKSQHDNAQSPKRRHKWLAGKTVGAGPSIKVVPTCSVDCDALSIQGTSVGAHDYIRTSTMSITARSQAMDDEGLCTVELCQQQESLTMSLGMIHDDSADHTHTAGESSSTAGDNYPLYGAVSSTNKMNSFIIRVI